MAERLLHLTISRVDEPLFDGEVQAVQVPGVAGEMQILANHKPLISPLKVGTVTITTAEGDRQEHDITGGTLEISDNHATVLV